VYQRQQVHGPHRKPPSQTWSAFLDNHLKTLVSVDFAVVPTIRFQILYVFLVLAHERRRIVHFAVTAHPTAEWTAQQIREAFLLMSFFARSVHRSTHMTIPLCQPIW